MEKKRIVEKAPYDPMKAGETKRHPLWMWRLTEKGKTYDFRDHTSHKAKCRREAVSKENATLTKLLEVMEGRKPMLSATIAREMGCIDSYMISGLLRRACTEGTVERTVRRGAAYFSLKRR